MASPHKAHLFPQTTRLGLVSTLGGGYSVKFNWLKDSKLKGKGGKRKKKRDERNAYSQFCVPFERFYLKVNYSRLYYTDPPLVENQSHPA